MIQITFAVKIDPSDYSHAISLYSAIEKSTNTRIKNKVKADTLIDCLEV